MLRCLRSLANSSADSDSKKSALAFAEQLLNQLIESKTPYETSRSERNHQRRYIALVLAEHGQAKKACAILKALTKRSPELAALQQEYAFALNACGQTDLAEEALYKALTLQPSNVHAHTQLARIQCRSGRTQAGYDSYLRATTLEPNNVEHYAHLLYWSNYLSSTTQQSNYQMARLWANKAGFKNQRVAYEARNASKEDAQGRIKLGLVSSDFCAHPVSFFVKPLLRGLNRDQFHITAYHSGSRNDAVSNQIRALSDDWQHVAMLSDKKLGQQIAEDNIDILLDMNGHNTGGRPSLFAQRLAPLQISWLGYPSTTGLRNMDFCITDRIADPVGLNDDFYSEALLRLPNGFLCYEPLSTAPDVSPRLGTDDRHTIRFGSFNSLAKISEQTLDCWAAAMHAVADSTICLKRQQLRNEGTRQYFLNEFEKRGIENDRVILLKSTSSIEQHLDEYNNIDIALDTSPYNGTTTTLEALWMGAPVISLLNDTHASRVSASILSRLDLAELAVRSAQEFADCAQNLTQDRAQLLGLKHGLRERMQQSSLLDYKRFGHDLGVALQTQLRLKIQTANKQQTPILSNSNMTSTMTSTMSSTQASSEVSA